MYNFFAPGRINLIGEHIDYNGGFVLPAAISLGIRVEIVENYGAFVSFKTNISNLNFGIQTNTKIKFHKSNDWTNYVTGVLCTLQDNGLKLPQGYTFNYTSTLPVGAGVSSSACIQVLTAFAMRSLANRPIDRTALALEAQYAENHYIGLPCGIMDQFAIANGKRDNAILLDCSTLKYEYIPLQLFDYQLVILNSNQPRSLIESKYHERKAECEAALAILQTHLPDLQNLCSATEADLVYLNDTLILQKRARHCITEQARVLAACKALKAHDLLNFGLLLNASHASLRDDYAVTGTVLDALVAAAQTAEGCIGARMTGAGFGGCAIAIVAKTAFTNFEASVKAAYFAETGLQTDIYIAEIVDGVGVG